MSEQMSPEIEQTSLAQKRLIAAINGASNTKRALIALLPDEYLNDEDNINVLINALKSPELFQFFDIYKQVRLSSSLENWEGFEYYMKAAEQAGEKDYEQFFSQDEDGCTIAHCMHDEGRLELAEFLGVEKTLELFSKQNYRKQNYRGSTVAHCMGDEARLKLAEFLGPEKTVELFSKQDKKGRTVSCWMSDVACLNLAKFLRAEKTVELYSKYDEDSNTVVHRMDDKSRLKLARFLESEKTVELFSKQDEDGRTVAHCMDDAARLKLAEILGPEKTVELFSKQKKYDNTVAHLMDDESRLKLAEILGPEKTVELFSKEDEDGDTVVQYMSDEIRKQWVESLPEHLQEKVKSIRNKKGVSIGDLMNAHDTICAVKKAQKAATVAQEPTSVIPFGHSATANVVRAALKPRGENTIV